MLPRPPCPVCGADNALARTGEQVHLPPRWLRWTRFFLHDYVSRTYRCIYCGGPSELVHIQARGRSSRRRERRRQPPGDD